MEARSWGVLAAGAAGGAAGTFAWLRLWGRRPGKVIRVGDKYYVQSSVVEQLGVQALVRLKDPAMLVIDLPPRGSLEFQRATWDGRPYGTLFHVTFRGDGDTEDIVRDLVSWGLALPGEQYDSIEDVPRGGGRTLGINFKSKAKLSTSLRPSGSYFKVGDTFYADARFLETIEWIPGSESSDNGSRVVIPFWKRGTLSLRLHTTARMLPEQAGALWRIQSQLAGVSLEDLLTELLQLGLVGWGGEWARFPSKLTSFRPTGTPPWNPAGHVVERNGELFVDEPVLQLARTRLEEIPTNEGIRLAWQGSSILFRPYNGVLVQGQHGTLYGIGRTTDSLVDGFVAEMILRRLAREVELHAKGDGA